MGVISLVGGLRVLLGYRAKIGVWLIVAFLLILDTDYAQVLGSTDPVMAQFPMISFMKNLSIVGGALLITQFGAGPLSLDARR